MTGDGDRDGDGVTFFLLRFDDMCFLRFRLESESSDSSLSSELLSLLLRLRRLEALRLFGVGLESDSDSELSLSSLELEYACFRRLLRFRGGLLDCDSEELTSETCDFRVSFFWSSSSGSTGDSGGTHSPRGGLGVILHMKLGLRFIRSFWRLAKR